MTRSILSGMLGLLSVLALGGLPVACQSGGVGDPCIPEDEYKTDFAGFKVTEENIESRSFQCQTRICLVNHFQGRVSCPFGQPAGRTAADGCQSADWDQGLTTEAQRKEAMEKEKQKACCVPGTNTVIEAEICGQCAGSPREAEQAVYCSCRCGVAEGAAPDPNFNFCECPTGYTCEEIRPDVGLGDPLLTGKYCIKQDTSFNDTRNGCQFVEGHHTSAQCQGTKAASSTDS